MYNLSCTENATSLTPLVQCLNTESSGILGIGILAVVFLGMLIITKRYEQDFIDAFLTTSFVSSVIAVLLLAIQLITWETLLFPLLILFASSIMKKFLG